MKPKKESWVPLEITALVEPLDYEERSARRGIALKGEMPAHCSAARCLISRSRISPPDKERRSILFSTTWAGTGTLASFEENGHADMSAHRCCSDGSGLLRQNLPGRASRKGRISRSAGRVL